MRKYARYAGADQKTPSVPQYFSWINNTNEGSTEAQTLANLDFFGWLKKEYGMQIRIYAWDAGNFDGASMGYGDPLPALPSLYRRRRASGRRGEPGSARLSFS